VKFFYRHLFRHSLSKIVIVLLISHQFLSAVEITVSLGDDLQGVMDWLQPGDILSLRGGMYYSHQIQVEVIE